MFDPDDIVSEPTPEAKALESLFSALDDADLGAWDREFVDSMLDRIKKRGANAVAASLTSRQREQINRLKREYDVEENDAKELF